MEPFSQFNSIQFNSIQFNSIQFNKVSFISTKKTSVINKAHWHINESYMHPTCHLAVFTYYLRPSGKLNNG
ncbi:hypothetical protein [Vibrio gallaecicus]|uniref:hypothetical protein n=1 Tax=Vibrio gallaecicus TaxID=552386 RepID=UPI0025B5FC91|nr:hypothetical protein [Vibrio gallaecicus]MDN3613727.1 hypothetical protein [Vibrio gallaecicus]